MSKADLHVHSKFSEHLSERFFRDMGAAESFSEPEFIYRAAKEHGMDFVTITDHNRIEGALLLHEKHPLDTFTGIEVSAYFPEDGCPIHLLVYGLTEAQYADINRLRTNLYDLCGYLRQENLVHSVAHATYSRSDKMNAGKLEKLILLFDVFESVNGGNCRMNNNAWADILSRLTPSFIEDIYRKHRIEPASADPWVKGFTGGSDDHCGLFLGKTSTVSGAQDAAAFLESVRNRKTHAAGRSSDFQSLAFTLYKLVHDFSKARKGPGPASSFIGRINDLVFEKKPLRFRDKVVIKGLRYRTRRGNDSIKRSLLDLVDTLNAPGELPIDKRLDAMYDTIASISDGYVRQFLSSASGDLTKGDLEKFADNIAAPFMSLLLSAPFLAAFRYTHRSHNMTKEFQVRFAGGEQGRNRQGLWFADTAADLDFALRAAAELGLSCGAPHDPVKLVTSLQEKEKGGELPASVLDLPSIYSFIPPYDKSRKLAIPSVLGSLKMLYACEPDDIYVSTMGPVALLGILVAKLLGVRSVGVYDPAYHRAIGGSIEADSIANLFARYTGWFYSQMDEIYVPDLAAMDFLERAGVNRTKMNLFARNLDFTFDLPAAQQ